MFGTNVITSLTHRVPSTLSLEKFEADQVSKEINALQKSIGQKMKAKQDASTLLAEKKALEEKKETLLAAVKASEEAWKHKLMSIGNLVHDSVTVSNNEDNNAVIRTWSPDNTVPIKGTALLSHHEVLHRIDGYDQERGMYVPFYLFHMLRR